MAQKDLARSSQDSSRKSTDAIDTCNPTPRASNVEFKIHFCLQCVHMCKLILQTHGEQ